MAFRLRPGSQRFRWGRVAVNHIKTQAVAATIYLSEHRK